MPSSLAELFAPPGPYGSSEYPFIQNIKESRSVFTIRLVNVDKDIPAFARWMNEMKKEKNITLSNEEIKGLKITYEGLLRDKNAQSFLCLIDDKEVLQIDIFDKSHTTSPALKSDSFCVINFIHTMDDKPHFTRQKNALKLFLQHVCETPQIKRIYCKFYEGNITAEIMLYSGFKKLRKESESDLYEWYYIDCNKWRQV